MRSSSELKSYSTSLRMTSEQHSIIEKNAKLRNMSISEYMIDCAIHRECGLNPEVMVTLQNIANEALQIARSQGIHTEMKMQNKVNELWLKLN